jgi:hypothetical protein
MAGLAEAAVAAQLTLNWLSIFVVGGLLIVAWARHSAVWAWVAATLGFALAMLIMPFPWEVFRPIDSDDPDALHWLAQARTVTTVWLTLIAGILVSVPLIGRAEQMDIANMDLREN